MKKELPHRIDVAVRSQIWRLTPDFPALVHLPAIILAFVLCCLFEALTVSFCRIAPSLFQPCNPYVWRVHLI